MSVASGNATVYTNDTGLTFLSGSGVIQLTASSIKLAGPVTSSGLLNVPGLTVTGDSSLQKVTAQALTATTGTFSGALSTAVSASVAGPLVVQGLSSLASAALTGTLAVAGTSALQGPLTCSAAATLQSLTVVAATQLQAALTVGGTSSYAGAATFNGGITCATNTLVSGHNLTMANDVTVGNKLRINSILARPVEFVNRSTDATQALQIYLDRTAVAASCNATLTLSTANGLEIAAGGKTALKIGTADQQAVFTSFRQGDTLKVVGDGSISATTELVLDNTLKAAGQIGRLGCDASGMYLSPNLQTKPLVLGYNGLLTASKGVTISSGLTADTAAFVSLTAATATLTNATFGSLNCNSLTAASGSPLTLLGGDSAKTVIVPGSFVASTLNGAANTAITLKGGDVQSTTVVSGRLSVDTILSNAASNVTFGSPTVFQSTVTAPTAVLAALQVNGSVNNSAFTSYDCTASALGFKATAGVVVGTGYQLAVNATPIYTVAPDTKLTTFTNAVQLNNIITVNGATTLKGSLAVTGATVFGSSITPLTDATLNLGSSTARWSRLFVSGSLVLPSAGAFTGKLSDLTQDSLMLQGQQVINFAGPRGLVVQNASTTSSSTADIVFDRSAISNTQVGSIGMNGDAGGLFLSTNNAQRVNIGTNGLVGIGGVAGVSPLTLAASTSAAGFRANGLYIYNSNTASTVSAPQNAIITTQVQSQNNTALAYHCFDNTLFSWSLGMRGNDPKLYLSPSSSGPFAAQKLSLDQSGNMVLGGGLLVADGSVTLPAYGFASDNRNDTGFYHPAEGVIGVSVNGAQSMLWNADRSISIPGNVSVASNLTTADLSCNGFAGISTLGVNQNTTLTGTLTVGSTSKLRDTTITSATTTSSMLRLMGATANQAEASLLFSRSGTTSLVWNMGHGAFSGIDDFVIGGGQGQGECIRIGASNGFVSMRHSYGTSDRNEKKDIQACASGLNFVGSLKPVEYRWKNGGDGKKHWGFIAQDIEEIMPEQYGAVISSNTGVKSLAYTELIAPMAKAIQELRAEVELLKSKLAQPPSAC